MNIQIDVARLQQQSDVRPLVIRNAVNHPADNNRLVRFPTAECRIRAIAAVHAVVGLGLMISVIGMLWQATNRTYGHNNLGSIAVVFVAGAAAIASVVQLFIAVLLWRYHPTGKWIAVVLWTVAAGTASYTFPDTCERILSESAAWGPGEPTYFWYYLGGGTIEVLIVAWTGVFLINVFRSESRRVFTVEYRQSFAATQPEGPAFWRSLLFVVGVVMWTSIAAVLLFVG